MTGAVGSGAPELDEEFRRLLAVAGASELPEPDTCLRLARVCEKRGDPGAAVQWAYAVSDVSEELAQWSAAGAVARRCLPALAPLPRTARVAVLGSYTTAQFAALLPLACARTGVGVEVYECGYGQYRQEILDPGSGLYAFAPDVVILAVHAGELDLPVAGTAAVGTAVPATDPDGVIEREAVRWSDLWEVLRVRTGARVVQHLLALPPESELGHLAARTPGSSEVLARRVNLRLGELAHAGDVSVVDCDRLAASVGKDRWFDARYWFRSKQAVSLACVPMLARHTAAVIAASLGTSRKCLVLDLDNTLWGGVLGEDGLSGIQLGDGAVGEAFSAFQAYVLRLKARGVVLAVCSKNNPDDAREVFEKHPDMLLGLDDIAVFSAGWQDKPTQLRVIASTLGLGLDALVFVDDNPAEREVVRQLVPEVDVVALPRDPAGYVRALSQYLLFEPAGLTAEDGDRTALYRAKARTAELEQTASSLEEFLDGLAMVATVVPLDEVSVPRVAQLIGKTNQFNLTGRRRSVAEVAALVDDPAYAVVCVRLADRFADHGLVGVLIGRADPDAVFTVDTWLMSCRVIGRTLEHETLTLAAEQAQTRGCTSIRGIYAPSAKNGLVADLYERLGFSRELAVSDAGRDLAVTQLWHADLADLPASPGHIAIDRAALPTLERSRP